MLCEIDENIIVTFRQNSCTLKEAIEKCQPGESIEGAPVVFLIKSI